MIKQCEFCGWIIPVGNISYIINNMLVCYGCKPYNNQHIDMEKLNNLADENVNELKKNIVNPIHNPDVPDSTSRKEIEELWRKTKLFVQGNS